MKSLAQKIALQFFAVIALIVAIISAVVTLLLVHGIREGKKNELMLALTKIEESLAAGNSIHEAEIELPYYITYTIYNPEKDLIIATNDLLLPILPQTGGRTRTYKEKGYYTDGDLFVWYKTKSIHARGDELILQVANSGDDATDDFLSFAPKVAALICLPLLIISYLSALLIAKRTLRPIVGMTKAAKSIGTSNLGTLLHVTGKHDELDSLAITFNELFLRIKRDFVALNEANTAKSRFLSNMSHEIRTPITAVLGLDEMILRESTESAIRSYARDIKSSGKSLLSIINDILDFSKIEAGKMEIIRADYDVATMLGDIINMVSYRAEDKGLEFIVSASEKIPRVLNGDDARIKQCVLNILTNAIKYTEKGSVKMSVTAEDAGSGDIFLCVEVRDTGIGIKAEEMERLFSPFERLDESRNRSIEGTGLGMSIVRSLLDAMGSKLEVESEYGKGSDFSFKVRQGVRSSEPLGDFGKLREEAERADNRREEHFQAPMASALIVDDTPMNLTVIKGLLKDTLIKIDTAENGFDALEMTRKKKYDVILVDHRMPKMDGIEFLHAMKSDDAGMNGKTACIALTANALHGAEQMYVNEGFDAFLQKPVDPASLERTIRRVLPENLVIEPGTDGFSARTCGKQRRTAELWTESFGIDAEAGLSNCGSADILLQAVREFAGTIDSRAAKIEESAREKDWDNYTIIVHSLKSCSRLLGATELSEMAAEAEKLGDRAKKGDERAAEEAAEKTPGILKFYRSYSEKLAPLCAKKKDGDKKLPVLSDDEISDALSALREVVSAFDFDMADMIVAEIEQCALPESFECLFAKIKAAVHDADQKKALELIESR